MITKNILVSLLIVSGQAFSLFGIHPKDYAEGERLPIYATRMTSSKTGMEADYLELPWCKNLRMQEDGKIDPKSQTFSLKGTPLD